MKISWNFLSRKLVVYSIVSIIIISSLVTVLLISILPYYKSIKPISINSDTELERYSRGGIGTEGDPYRIERYKIKSGEDIGIRISGTTKHFIIKDCYIEVNAYSILIADTEKETVTVTSNTCISSFYGIYFYNTTGSLIRNNVCRREKRGNYIWWFEMQFGGIYIRRSINTTVSNNFCSQMIDFGIFLETCEGILVSNNTCEYTFSGIATTGGCGILSFRSSNVTISNNIVKNNMLAGIGTSNSEDILISDNDFQNNGFIIDDMWLFGYDFSTLKVVNNTVNSKRLGYFYNITNKIIEEPDFGQIILCECENITIRNQVLTNVHAGISLINSTGLNITQNQCSNGIDGIHALFCTNSSFMNNICTNNSYAGIHLDYYCASNNFEFNICNNNKYGIYLWYSSYCNLTYNMLKQNRRYGVYINMNSRNNSVHHNTFIDNHQETIHYFESSQAYQKELYYPNYWYDVMSNEGNFWSDWEGIGAYKIDCIEGDVYDKYPLSEPTIN